MCIIPDRELFLVGALCTGDGGDEAFRDKFEDGELFDGEVAARLKDGIDLEIV
jgi:hypothetical protein